MHFKYSKIYFVSLRYLLINNLFQLPLHQQNINGGLCGPDGLNFFKRWLFGHVGLRFLLCTVVWWTLGLVVFWIGDRCSPDTGWPPSSNSVHWSHWAKLCPVDVILCLRRRREDVHRGARTKAPMTSLFDVFCRSDVDVHRTSVKTSSNMVSGHIFNII